MKTGKLIRIRRGSDSRIDRLYAYDIDEEGSLTGILIDAKLVFSDEIRIGLYFYFRGRIYMDFFNPEIPDYDEYLKQLYYENR